MTRLLAMSATYWVLTAIVGLGVAVAAPFIIRALRGWRRSKKPKSLEMEGLNLSENYNAKYWEEGYEDVDTGSINDTSDAFRDAIEGATKITLTVVVDIDSCTTNNSRVAVIQHATNGNNPQFGFACVGISTNEFRFYWEQAIVETFTEADQARHVWTIVVDTTQATEANRVIVYQDGIVHTSTESAELVKDDTFTLPSTHDWIFLNRLSGTWSRSIVGALDFVDIYAGVAFSTGQVTAHNDILASDGDAE